MFPCQSCGLPPCPGVRLMAQESSTRQQRGRIIFQPIKDVGRLRACRDVVLATVFFFLPPFGVGAVIHEFFYVHPFPPRSLQGNGWPFCVADFVRCFCWVCRAAQCVEAQRVATAARCCCKTACSDLLNGLFCTAERVVSRCRKVATAFRGGFCKDNSNAVKPCCRAKTGRNVLPCGAKIISLHCARPARPDVCVAAGA